MHGGSYMKRQFIFVIVFILVAVASFAYAENVADTADNQLLRDELLEFVSNILEQEKNSTEPKADPQETELGRMIASDSVELYYHGTGTDAVLSGVKMKESIATGPRGEQLFDDVTSLIARYPNDNQTLYGDKEFATLYVDTDLPETASWGLVARDGQRIQSVSYTVSTLLEAEEYQNLNLVFEVNNGFISSIAVYGLDSRVPKAEVENSIAYAEKTATLKSYFAHPSSAEGSELDAFQREDLVFSGLDYLTLTPEAVLEKFGPADTDEISEGEPRLRTLSWDAIDASFVVNEQGECVKPYRFTIKDDVIEGPRALRIGDSFPDIYKRFRSEGNGIDNQGVELLYGEFGKAPYGIISYYADGLEMSMLQEIESTQKESTQKESIVINLNFEMDKLEEITLFTN